MVTEYNECYQVVGKIKCGVYCQLVSWNDTFLFLKNPQGLTNPGGLIEKIPFMDLV